MIHGREKKIARSHFWLARSLGEHLGGGIKRGQLIKACARDTGEPELKLGCRVNFSGMTGKKPAKKFWGSRWCDDCFRGSNKDGGQMPSDGAWAYVNNCHMGVQGGGGNSRGNRWGCSPRRHGGVCVVCRCSEALASFCQSTDVALGGVLARAQRKMIRTVQMQGCKGVRVMHSCRSDVAAQYWSTVFGGGGGPSVTGPTEWTITLILNTKQDLSSC